MPSESDAARPAALPSELIPDFERFRAALSALSAPDDVGATRTHLLAAHALAAWRDYGRLLYERSADLALVSRGDRAEIFTRHVLDSLNPVTLFDSPPRRILDIGSGGGLPGIPLAIAWPEARVFLLESRERKAGFLEMAVRSLGLRNARVFCMRL